MRAIPKTLNEGCQVANCNSSRYTWLIVALLWFVLLAPSLGAQSTSTGALTGTVTDATGAVVPNATVTVTSADTGQVRTTTTSANGSYNVGLLPPGNYRVRFDAAGFKEAEIPSATIVVTETATLNQALEVGSQAEKVTVQGDVETVQTSNATVGTVMTSQTVTALPLTTRNYTNLLGLTAGTAVGVFNAATIGRGTQDISVNGSSPNQNNFQMDGASVVSITGGGSALDNGGTSGIGIVNPDAIQEFKIQTSLYDAGYGRNPGANVNVVTKSGTNQFHGTAFEFFRNTALNANDFFRKSSPPVNGVANNGREVLNSNQYGGVFGGPVKKDKLFFFAAYQESQQKNGISSGGASTPTLAPIPAGDRSNTAAFKAALGATFCPTTPVTGGKTSNGGVQVACDGSNINPVAVAFLQLKNPDGTYYVPGSGTGKYSVTTFSIPARFEEHQAVGNLDFVINGKNTLSGRWFYTDGPTTYSFWCGTTVVGGTVPGTCLPSTGALSNYSVGDTVVKLTSILTNNVVNEARISLQRIAANPTNTVPFTNNQVGIASLTPAFNQLDEILLQGNASFTTGSYFGNGQNKYTTQWEAADQISWSHGKHTIRAGFEYERDRTNWNFFGLALGQETFNSFQDFLLGLPGCPPGNGACLTTPLPGTNGTTTSNIVNTGTTAAVIGPNGLIHGFRWGSANAFVQDDIKLSPRFTLNLGVRWEYDGAVADKYGDMTNIWPSLVNLVNTPGALGTSAATGTLAGFVIPSNYNPAINVAPPVGGVFQSNHKILYKNSPPIDDFAPRFGFAWQPLSTNRLVIRGGYGYFYDRLGLNLISAAATQGEPYAITIPQSGAANYFSTEAFPYGNPSPSLAWTPRWVNINASPTVQTASSSNLSQTLVQENIVTPLIQEWNLNMEYEFARTWVLELGYVGTHGIHQYNGNVQINEAQLASPANPVNGLTVNTTSNASGRVPYLGFSPAGMSTSETNGDVKFNSLQATVRKQMSHGLTMQAAYTWSKSLNDFTNAANNSSNSGDPNNLRQQYGPNPNYRPQRLAINYSWDLPFGHFEGLTGKLTNGWNVSGVTIAQDGTPLSVTDSRGGTIYGLGAGPVTSRAQFCPGMGPGNVSTPGGVESRLGGNFGGPGYLNPAAFCSIPTTGGIGPTLTGAGTLFGNSGVGIILGPGQFNWDMSLIKTTKVGGLSESAVLVFRAEFFNAFNHTQFNNPTTTQLDFSKSTFGQITSASVNPRVIQFGLKYIF